MRTAAIVLACCAAFAVALAAQGGGQGAGQGRVQAAGGPATGQSPAAPQTLPGEVAALYTTVSGNALKSAEWFPEAKYTWQPTPEVRTWAQLVAHMTDDANSNCWAIAGLSAAPARTETGATPAPNDRKKDDLVAGYKAAIAVCQKALANVTPANMLEPAGGRGNASKIGQLIAITGHTNEHYGNMVTYFRLQGCTPPSSARGTVIPCVGK